MKTRNLPLTPISTVPGIRKVLEVVFRNLRLKRDGLSEHGQHNERALALPLEATVLHFVRQIRIVLWAVAVEGWAAYGIYLFMKWHAGR